MWVLDTNTLIYFFKGMGDVAENLLNRSVKEIGIPSVVLFELEVGIAKSSSSHKRMQQLAAITSAIQLLPFGAKEATASAGIRAALEKKGTPIGCYDLLIAGTAVAHNAILVTHNTDEFKRVDKLSLTDWY